MNLTQRLAMSKLTCEIIYKQLTIDQIYRLGILLASYDLLQQQIGLRNYIDSEYGVISTDYMQNLIDCENLGKDYPKSLKQVIEVDNIDKEVLELCSILPVDMFYDVEQSLIKDETVGIESFQLYAEIKHSFNKLTRSLV